MTTTTTNTEPTIIELGADQSAIVFNADGNYKLYMYQPKGDDEPINAGGHRLMLTAVFLNNESFLQAAEAMARMLMERDLKVTDQAPQIIT